MPKRVKEENGQKPRVFKYKLRPNNKQKTFLEKTFGCCRFIYNKGIELREDARKKKQDGERETYMSNKELSAMLPLMKKEEDTKWLAEVPAVCLQQKLDDLDKAYDRAIKGIGGFPKYKIKGRNSDGCRFPQNGEIDFKTHHLYIPKFGRRGSKLGPLRFLKNKEFDTENGRIKSVTITKDKCGDYWASLTVYFDEEPVEQKGICEPTTVGIDLGVKHLAILSDGTKFENPKYYEKGERDLAVKQRAVSRKYEVRKKTNEKLKKEDKLFPSKREKRARLRVARAYRRTANRRENHLHQITTQIARDKYDTFALETLNVQGMAKNHRMAKSINSASPYEFKRQLKYKAKNLGKNVISIGRFEPSTQLCNVCGYKNESLTLNDREWTCPQCGTHHDRDVNAAINIKNIALNEHKEGIK